MPDALPSGVAPEAHGTERKRSIHWPFALIVEDEIMTPVTPEDEEQRLIDEAIQARIREHSPRLGGRRMSDGLVIRSEHLSVVGQLMVIVVPLLAMVFYVRDIASQVALIVREQSAQAAQAADHEQRIKVLESLNVRLDQAGNSRETRLEDHEARLRRLEGR